MLRPSALPGGLVRLETGYAYIYMPRRGTRGGIPLEHDHVASSAIDVEELLADHRSHVVDGSLAKLAAFDSEYVKKSNGRRFVYGDLGVYEGEVIGSICSFAQSIGGNR